MEKVKTIYYKEDKGLIFELEDGRLYAQRFLVDASGALCDEWWEELDPNNKTK